MSRIEILKNHYEPRIVKYDDNSRVLDWENVDAQYKRFKAMIDNLELEGNSILDIGCGCGDLFGAIKEKHGNVSYTGVDILEKMIERAVKEYPEAEFYCADIFNPDFCAEEQLGCKNFDITYTSGIFNLNAGNNEDFLKKAVPVLAGLAKKAFVFNLLDPSSSNRDDNYFYYEVEDAVKLAKPLCKELKLIQGYLDNDYTLIGLK